MRGLLIKDMRILMRQKMTFLIIVLLGIFMSMNGGDASFSLGYMMVVSAMSVVTTISYDYFENGMSFMFTLPISRKSYVVEKYVLALLVELVMAGFSVLIQVGSILLGNPADWMVLLITGVGCFVAAMLLLAVYIPVYIKCGPEKSRIVIFIVVGIVAVGTYLVAKVEAVQKLLEQLIETLSKLSAMQITVIGVAIFVLVMLASVGISTRMLEKKEF